MGSSTALVAFEPPGLTLEHELADRNPAAVYLSSLSSGSRRTMKEALNVIALKTSNGQVDAFTFNWPALGFQHTAAIRSWLAENYSSATANKMLSALRGVLRAARDLGLMSGDDYVRAASIRAVPGETLPKGRALSSAEIEALLEACSRDPSSAGVRDGALIVILRAGGLRRAELCNLDFADYDMPSLTLMVKGKRNKRRQVPLSKDAVNALSDWLLIRGQRPGTLFCPVGKNGVLKRDQRLTPQAVYKCVGKRAREAGISNLSPHDFRRTFVSDLLDRGADIATVQKLAGHSNIQTTARYDRRGEAARRQAIALLRTPYRRRQTG